MSNFKFVPSCNLVHSINGADQVTTNEWLAFVGENCVSASARAWHVISHNDSSESCSLRAQGAEERARRDG
ncbi:hypothetical protein V8C26DRAFT_399439, partial [Trichoderma gracile]